LTVRPTRGCLQRKNELKKKTKCVKKNREKKLRVVTGVVTIILENSGKKNGSPRRSRIVCQKRTLIGEGGAPET